MKTQGEIDQEMIGRQLSVYPPKSEPPVRSSELLEANVQETKVEEWSYKHDGEWTHIYDEDGNRLTTFYRKLTWNEVNAFKAGWGIGWDRGREAGKAQKAIEVRQALGL